MKFEIGEAVEISAKGIVRKIEEKENVIYYECTINNDARIVTLPESALFKLPEPKDFGEKERDGKDILREQEETDGDKSTQEV